MTAKASLILDVVGTSLQFTFALDEIDELVIGRKNPETGDTPDVDLGETHAVHMGVARRHAIIARRDGLLYVRDNGSPSGIRLNGQQVVANQSVVLRSGDDIRLGRMVLRVSLY